MIAAIVEPADERLERLEQVVKDEFKDLPGMHLTCAQFRRLWSLTQRDCEQILTDLLESGFLTQESGDCYRRSSPNRAM
jgi:hypothetical protein